MRSHTALVHSASRTVHIEIDTSAKFLYISSIQSAWHIA